MDMWTARLMQEGECTNNCAVSAQAYVGAELRVARERTAYVTGSILDIRHNGDRLLLPLPAMTAGEDAMETFKASWRAETQAMHLRDRDREDWPVF